MCYSHSGASRTYTLCKRRKVMTFVQMVIPEKLSAIHLHAWLFSNPRGKVLLIVGISCSPDVRVQHTLSSYFILITFQLYIFNRPGVAGAVL